MGFWTRNPTAAAAAAAAAALAAAAVQLASDCRFKVSDAGFFFLFKPCIVD